MLISHSKSVQVFVNRASSRWRYLVFVFLSFHCSFGVSKGLEDLSENVEEVSKTDASNPVKSPDATLRSPVDTTLEPAKVESVGSPKIPPNTLEEPIQKETNEISTEDNRSKNKESTLEKNYETGFNLGFQSVKFSSARLDSVAGARVFATKLVPLLKNSFKSRVIVGYQPLTGTMRVNERDHDIASHGLTGGLVADYSIAKPAVYVRISGEIGYFLTYSHADDGLEPESRSKLNAATFIVNSSALWQLSSGTKVGPQITLAGGQVSWINLGISSIVEF
jgi:hypothetical protein